VLLKEGRLTADEYEQIKQHAELGAQIVREVLAPEQVEWVRRHHERPDGRGYPGGLSGEDIPEGAAIIGLCDAWDVMTSERSYSPSMPIDVALGQCVELAGVQFARGPVSVLCEMVADGQAVVPEVVELLGDPLPPRD
jgi:HD-GYP domain-containing protein (c-di-GMP phosphodiesterase class II)